MQPLNLAKAKAELEQMLGVQLERLDPDTVAALFPGIRWKSIVGWGTASDEDVSHQTNLDLDLGREGGTITLVTDPSFYVGGCALSFSPAELSAASAFHLSETNERIFGGGDVLVWSAASSSIWLFHHEGIFAKASCGSLEP